MTSDKSLLGSPKGDLFYNPCCFMTVLLAIDTATTGCAVALSHDGGFYQQRTEAQQQSAQQILPLIAGLLDSAGLQLGQVQVLVVAAGPGSFTGIRIGIGVCQGLSMALNTPCVPLSTLAVRAGTAMRSGDLNQVVVCERARMGEVYLGAYQRAESLEVALLGREQVAVPELLRLESSENCSTAQWCATGDAWGDVELANRLRKSLGLEPEIVDLNHPLQLEDLCRLGHLRFLKGLYVDAERIRPNYIKEQLDYRK